MELWRPGYENGKKRFSKSFQNGIEHGIQGIYFENGKIRKDLGKISGKYHGEFRGYYKEYEDGTIQKIC